MKKIQSKKSSPKSKQNVVVIGMGYVGFPLACAIARSRKYNIIGYDIDLNKIEKINKRISPVEDEQAEKDIKQFKFLATNDDSVLKDAKFIIVCVPTPVDHDKNPDLTPVVKSTETIAKHLKKGQYVILESTVNPGVCEESMLPILEATGLKGGIDFELLHCPERINPGDENWNVYNIPRNIGGLTQRGTKIAADFYRSFIKAEIREVSSIKAAEATKIVENTFRDVNIAYVNELAQFFDLLGVDLMEVINGASSKPFAFMPHYPGCGVGGHCIPVDPYYLIQKAQTMGFNHELLKVARKVNNYMPVYTVNKLQLSLAKKNINLKGAKIGILGLSYKANIGDMRESPSLEIRDELIKRGADVVCHDPHVNGYSETKLNDVLENCVGVILATNHKEFLKIKDWKNVKVVIDGKNCLAPAKFNNGTHYEGIGRGRITSNATATRK